MFLEGDSPPSSVRMLRFLKHSLGEDDEKTLLLVGTSGGILYIHRVEKFKEIGENCIKIREIRMKHEAPIIHVEIMVCLKMH